MSQPAEIWSVGYGAWPVATRALRLVECLAVHGITRLVDVRLSPCASDLVVGRPYGPKAWNLQAPGAGIAQILAAAGIAYEWIVELGNPQKSDPAMTILRGHLADPAGAWPVHRGLALLAEIVRQPAARIAILCACGDASSCHRSLIAAALNDRHCGGQLAIHVIDAKAPPRSRHGPAAAGSR